MRYAKFVGLLLLQVAVTVLAFGQTERAITPIPAEPLELATGAIGVADTPEKRASALALVERARQNSNLHSPGSQPFELRASLNSTGSLPFEGSGTLEEVWASPGSWQWSERLGSYSQTRIFYRGLAYDKTPKSYQPLRLHMARGAIFWPVNRTFSSSVIRTTSATYNGTAVTCVLVSGGASEPGAAAGRRWQEEEFCIDPRSGLLQTYSIAPGLYYAYDYEGAIQFHGRTLARQISIVENGLIVAQLRLDSLQDLGAVEQGALTPQQGMTAPGPIIRSPTRIRRIVRTTPGASSGIAQPVIVHASIDARGRVLEAEALQVSDPALSNAALELVRSADYGASRGNVPSQREMYINVEFLPPQ